MKQHQVLLIIAMFILGSFLVACENETSPLGLYEIGNEEFAEIVASNSESGYLVYIGRPTCQYCRQLEPILEEALHYLESSMYYFQTAKARYMDEDKMLELLDPLGIDGIPIIIHLVDGFVTNYLIGVNTQDEIIAFINATR